MSSYGDYGRRRERRRDVAATRSRTKMMTSSADYFLKESKDAVLVKEARSWAEDCSWVEDSEEIKDMSDYRIVRGVDRHYDGGWEQFKKDCGDLTL